LKNIQIPNFIKIRPVRAELFRADGQIDMTKLTVAFVNFANAHKSDWTCLYMTIQVKCDEVWYNNSHDSDHAGL
jgi:hypothetical protein